MEVYCLTGSDDKVMPSKDMSSSIIIEHSQSSQMIHKSLEEHYLH